MKYFKYSILLLTIAVFTDFALAKAYSSPASVLVSPEIAFNGVYTSDTFEKNTGEDVRQRYENSFSATAWTNPCNDCQIAARVRATQPSMSNPNETIDVYPEGVVTVMGQTGRFNDLVNKKGDNLIYVWRHDSTLLKTYHSALWYLNMNKMN